MNASDRLAQECGQHESDMAYGFWVAAQAQDTSTPKCEKHALRISFTRGTCPFGCGQNGEIR